MLNKALGLPDELRPAHAERSSEASLRHAAQSGYSNLFGWKAFANLIIALALSAGAGLAVRSYAEEIGTQSLARQADERLNLLAATFVTRLERFRYLPNVIARSREIENLLADQANTESVKTGNRLLKSLGDGAGALALYVINADGLTLAASNHDQPGSFVGQNYRFRPYFQDAITIGEGRYYGVGVTTGEPGYFLSTGVRSGNDMSGVAVVKIDLLPLETQWREAGELVSVVDSTGVIFLSSEPAWRYQATRPISTADRDLIQHEKRYGNASLVAVPWRPLDENSASGRGVHLIAINDNRRSEARVVRTMPLGEIGWSLVYLANPAPARLQANIAGLAAFLAALLACAALLILAQRRQVRKVERQALKQLEARVVERTAALVETNRQLSAEIAERKTAQRELGTTRSSLDQAAKLATIGQAFAGFTHEINQPLAAFRTYISSTRLLLDQNRTSEIRGNIDVMDGVVERILSLTNQLKGLARRDADDFEEINISLLVGRIADLLRFRFEQFNIVFTSDLASSGPVTGSRSRLEQMMLNLLTNAIDAVENVQYPRVEISSRDSREGCVIAVHDNGPGIDDAVADELFKPFFTTKAPGKGLGLGLSIVHRIVTDHQGTISCGRSHLGGAVFTVWLPCRPRIGGGSD
ncbi:sensor histidine kinase [Taklimakanibacter deserti]|uniref:sensor histidine kinase n=1 Tax=Taklimakanibacter deserti TaxID=2267839 RepID=UPI0034D4995B